jgi:hypothetical protein
MIITKVRKNNMRKVQFRRGVILFIFVAVIFAQTGAANAHLVSMSFGGKAPNTFEEFVASVTNGYARLVTGVFVPDVLALPVLQQPNGNPAHITTKENAATQFGIASDYGAIGILAHNFLAGEQFVQLKKGMKVYVVYGDGSYKSFVVDKIRHFQALQPNSPRSNFLDLDNSNAQLSADQLFHQTYGQSGSVVLQTCIEDNGINTWGRLIIIAK